MENEKIEGTTKFSIEEAEKSRNSHRVSGGCVGARA